MLLTAHFKSLKITPYCKALAVFIFTAKYLKNIIGIQYLQYKSPFSLHRNWQKSFLTLQQHLIFIQTQNRSTSFFLFFASRKPFCVHHFILYWRDVWELLIDLLAVSEVKLPCYHVVYSSSARFCNYENNSECNLHNPSQTQFVSTL